MFNAEELQDVRAQRSLKRLVAAAVQPRHRRFAVRPEERHDRKGRLAFLSGQVRGVQSLGFTQQRTHTFRICLQAFRQRNYEFLQRYASLKQRIKAELARGKK